MHRSDWAVEGRTGGGMHCSGAGLTAACMSLHSIASQEHTQLSTIDHAGVQHLCQLGDCVSCSC